ncbi:hypothetical protein [Alloactinosynnema sp. L-07]|uniref:hypothetical protein n=1 Tax=Alloactinosynnema sp. L-07 TaxID=1653480 RepID=UPI00065EFF26|nr:hypothetical protein [Alloactinosynnema sp. L-07]CRK56930.1 hypothetical protein [Alloactinosynnema sp. L-07]
MNDREQQLDDERQRIRDAAQRLLDGHPHRSSGKLTVSTLATEAAVTRQRLYEHHTDLVDQFKTAAGGGPIAPDVEALRHQLAAAHKLITQLEHDNKQLRGKIAALCAVITELTHETYADNVVTLPQRRRPRPSTAMRSGQTEQTVE